MSTGRVLRPLVAGSTYRRFVHLLLGAVLLLPYLAVAGLFVLSVREGDLDPVATVGLAAVAAAIGIGAAFVPGVRALEITAARALLDARIDDPAGPDDGLARRRAALWLLVNLLAGAAVTLLTLVVVPWSLGFLLAPWVAFTAVPTGLAAAWAPPVGLLLPALLLYVVAVVGQGLARLAPRLLGPSAAERLAVELARSREAERVLAHRNRLARELHDSVGHALTVTTLQAGAAARVLDSDRRSSLGRSTPSPRPGAPPWRSSTTSWGCCVTGRRPTGPPVRRRPTCVTSTPWWTARAPRAWPST